MNIAIKKRSPYGVISLTLGIISIVYSFFIYISLPAGILAITLGVKGKNMVGSKLSNAGKITGIVGLSLTAAALLIKVLIVLIAFWDAY